MKNILFQSAFIACLSLASAHAFSPENLDLHVGLSPSKSTLGVGVGNEIAELNAGMKNHPLEWFATRDMILQPGLSYNHRLPGGLYASATYAPVFVRFGDEGPYPMVALSRRTPFVGQYSWLKEGWNAGEIFIGLGKTFQFNRFGIVLDGNLITPATEDFSRSWAYWVGLGISYRFKLE